MKRTDYISWDEYFMDIAMLAAKRSKDPATQGGARIATQEKNCGAAGCMWLCSPATNAPRPSFRAA